MDQLVYCGALIFLAVLSTEDIKERRISVKKVVAGALIAIICRLVMGQTGGIEIADSLVPGVVLFVLSIMTKESIGKGDGIVVMTLGLWIGGWRTFLVVCLAIWVTGVFAVISLIRKKRELIPFVPCLLIGMEVLLLYA